MLTIYKTLFRKEHHFQCKPPASITVVLPYNCDLSRSISVSEESRPTIISIILIESFQIQWDKSTESVLKVLPIIQPSRADFIQENNKILCSDKKKHINKLTACLKMFTGSIVYIPPYIDDAEICSRMSCYGIYLSVGRQRNAVKVDHVTEYLMGGWKGNPAMARRDSWSRVTTSCFQWANPYILGSLDYA